MKETFEEIKRILAATPYTREEIAALWKKEEDEQYFAPENIHKLLALRAAYDYYQTHKIDKGFSYKKYQKELKKLMKYYECPPSPILH